MALSLDGIRIYSSIQTQPAVLQELPKESQRIFIFLVCFHIKLFHNKAEEGIG